jgi:hypothetical protein
LAPLAPPPQIIGEYRGTAGDESGVPNFYDQFCNRLGKPMVIGEVRGEAFTLF